MVLIAILMLLQKKMNVNLELPVKLLRKRGKFGFPGGPVVKSPPYNARNTGSILGAGRSLAQATEQLSPRATTTGSVRWSL